MTASLEQLGAFVSGHKPDADARAAVRRHVADTVGAWIAAKDTAEGQRLLAHRTASAGLLERVALNAALTRLSEVDDIHLGAMITAGSIVVPLALTMAAEIEDASESDIAAAIVVGYEAMVRFGVAIDGPSVLYRGIWPTYFAAPFGAAAVAARLLRLDADRSAQALANAFILTTPGTGHHAASTTMRWLAVGYAVARGVQAAQAAQAGFTSDLKLPDGAFLKNVYSLASNNSALARGGADLALHQVSYKPWCAARQTMAVTQALKEILAEGMVVDDIRSIEACVLPPHQQMIDHGVTPGDQFSHLTSAPYQMAVAAISPDTAYALAASEVTPLVQSFMTRIRMVADQTLLAEGYPAAWAGCVRVTTGAGVRERLVRHVPGDPALPFSDDDLKRKFVRVVTPLLEAGAAAAMFDRALSAIERPLEILREIDRIGPVKA